MGETLSKLLQEAKELIISCQNCIKQSKGWKKLSLSQSKITRTSSLEMILLYVENALSNLERRIQQKKLGWYVLLRNIIIDGDKMIDKETGEVLDFEADYTCYKEKF